MKKPLSKKQKIFLYALLAAGVIAAIFVIRTLYVVFYDPMRAFQTPAPAYSAAPSITIPATPIKTPSPAPSSTPKQESPAPATPEPTPLLTVEEAMANRVNILLVGYDKSPEREIEENDVYRGSSNNYRSDVLMLLMVDFAGKNAHLISIPRDSYAPLYNQDGELYGKNGKWKINAAFAKGGGGSERSYKFAMQTVSKLLGVPISYYAGVDMSGLKGVVNAMGGVEYDVDIPIRINGRKLSPGLQKLNGQQVLDYCRARKGIGTDVTRSDRQQRMLFAIFNQLKSRDQLRNFPEIYKAMKKHITTNLNLEQIAAIAAFGAELSMDDLHRHTLSGEYNDHTPYSSTNYYLIDNAALAQLIRDIYSIQIEVNPRYDLYYVLGDIAAKDGLKDIRSAQYLLSHKAVRNAYPQDSEGAYLSPSLTLEALLVTVDRLQQLCTRPEEALDTPFDTLAIEQARQLLYTHMLTLCRDVGITKGDVSSSRMPKEVYNRLS